MLPQHSSKTSEHYTPQLIVERARALLGAFDLDPASCMDANDCVNAEKYYTKEDDGLTRPWYGRVFLNPPGGRGPGNAGMVAWWDHLVTEWDMGRIESAFFVGFTLEILRSSQWSRRPIQDFPRCYPSKRLKFGGNSPTHANVLVYLPPERWARMSGVYRLEGHFGDIGLCESGRG